MSDPTELATEAATFYHQLTKKEVPMIVAMTITSQYVQGRILSGRAIEGEDPPEPWKRS